MHAACNWLLHYNVHMMGGSINCILSMGHPTVPHIWPSHSLKKKRTFTVNLLMLTYRLLPLIIPQISSFLACESLSVVFFLSLFEKRRRLKRLLWGNLRTAVIRPSTCWRCGWSMEFIRSSRGDWCYSYGSRQGFDIHRRTGFQQSCIMVFNVEAVNSKIKNFWIISPLLLSIIIICFDVYHNCC